VTRSLALGTRTLLYSTLPISLVLGASVYAVSAAAKDKVRQGLKESIVLTEQKVSKASLEFNRRTAKLIGALSENAGLKAGIDLVHQIPPGDPNRAQAVETLEEQLSELSLVVECDFLAVQDSDGRTIAAVKAGGIGAVPLQAFEIGAKGNGFLMLEGVPYEVTSAPITLTGEFLGELTVGKRFDLATHNLADHVALLRDGRILLSTLSADAGRDLEKELASHCRVLNDGCQINVGAESYMVFQSSDAEFSDSTMLLYLQSLDARTNQVTAGLMEVLLIIGAVGLLSAIVVSWLGSRAVSRPLATLVGRLKESESTGRLPSDLDTGSSVQEVNMLAKAFNNTAVVLREASDELTRAKSAAESASRAKTEFLATMSHEIRTPLNGVIGMSELIQETSLSDEQKEFTGTLRSSAQSLLSLLNDILDYSKIEAGMLPIESIPFDLSVTLDEVADLLAPAADKKGLELVFRYAPDTPRRFLGDPGRIRQVLLNLAGNAIKFATRGHVLIDVEVDVAVDVEAEPRSSPEPRLRISVTDTGIGISHDKIASIFDRFTQGDSSTTRRYGGTGLGLAICKQLVDLMGGTMGVNSREGEGSTFWISLPLSPDSAGVPALPDSWRSLRVLAVDQGNLSHRVLHEQLAQCGTRNDRFALGKEALAMLREARAHGEPYDLVIAEHRMPDMDGFTLSQEIKADAALQNTPVVVLTSIGQLAASHRGNEPVPALMKPVRYARIIETLARAAAVKTGPRIGVANAPHPAPVHQKQPRRTEVFPVRALVVDDNVVNRAVASGLLKKFVSHVDAASSGLEAIELVRQEFYDFIFMDCQMPGMDGYEATARIRELEIGKKHSIVVALTADAMPGARQRCLDAGMDDYSTKPINRDEIFAVLNAWLCPEAAESARTRSSMKSLSLYVEDPAEGSPACCEESA
jgi:signal transduction histidine kinase/DNA-binding response OmpR family regulator